MANEQWLVMIAALAGLFMAWGIGANDVANAAGTAVGSKVLNMTQVIVAAVIFESMGAIFAGNQVADTIRSRIIDTSILNSNPDLVVLGMLAALLAAGTWLTIASYFGWPVSTTHSIIGAIGGFTFITLGAKAIYWPVIFNITLSWIVTPIIAGFLAFLLFRSVQILIFDSNTPIEHAKRYVPVYIFLVSIVIFLVAFVQGFDPIGLHLRLHNRILLSFFSSLVLTIIGVILLRGFTARNFVDGHINFVALEKIFGLLMVFTSCAMLFAHGSNDIANTVGPLSAIIDIVRTGQLTTTDSIIPLWVVLLGALGVISGIIMYGHRVISTIGNEITQLTPSRGFAAQLATACTVIIASGLGLPISTTQTLVGAILGVGFARGIAALNLTIIRNIFMSWIITLPAGALFAIGYYHLLKLLIGRML